MKSIVSRTDISDRFEDTPPGDIALQYITTYGKYDGSDHKQWVLDQVARILLGAQPTIEKVEFEDGSTEVVWKEAPKTEAYKMWVNDITGGNPEAYSTGVAP